MINNDLFANETIAPSTHTQMHLEQTAQVDFSAGEEGSIKLRSIWVSVEHAEQLHLRHFCPATINQPNQSHTTEPADEASLPGQGRTVFMLHGEAECGRVFYGSQQRGLAWYLAKQGYEVFVADLGARGRSLVTSGEQTRLTVNELITKAIPRLLQACGEHSHYTNGIDVAKPDVWVGHGFGAVLLSAAWTRLDDSLRNATQMIFLSARRSITPACFATRLFSKMLGHPITRYVVRTLGGVPAKKLKIGSANENAAWYQSYMQWLDSEDWVDSSDGYDYRAAFAKNSLPPVLHLAPREATFYSSPDDTRRFVEELGAHNARLIFVDRNSESGQAYNHLSMLLAKEAEQDIFADASIWLANVDAFDQTMQQADQSLAVDINNRRVSDPYSDDLAISIEDEQLEIESLHVDSDDRFDNRQKAISFA